MLVLDAGAFLAIERGDRRTAALLRAAQIARTRVVTSGGVVAQVWRDGRRQAHVARALAGTAVVALDAPEGRRVGELLRRSGTADVVDAHVALLAGPGGALITNDPDDLARLLAATGSRAVVIAA